MVATLCLEKKKFEKARFDAVLCVVQSTGMTRFLILVWLGGLFSAAGIFIAEPARAEPLSQVVTTIQNSGGRYVRAGASLSGSDCSGLVSVAQSLAMGVPIHRFGDTRSIMRGAWPGVTPGATHDDIFVIGANWSHMVVSVGGVNIESSMPGQPYRVGALARSPWSPEFQQWHLNPKLIIA